MHSPARRPTRATLLLAAVLGSLAVLLILGWDQAQMVTGLGLPERTGAPMLIVAHRGNTAAFPEDTAEAVWDAATRGADGIEFDVHQSADGTWWLIHDSSVDRTTDGTGLVSALPDIELDGLHIDAGRGFEPARHAGMRLSRLSTVLDGLGEFPGDLYVDLQHAIEADPADLAEILAGTRSTVICRDLDDARRIEGVDPGLRTLLLADRLEGGEGVDAVFLEAVGEATVGRVASHRLPVVTYMDERYSHFPQDVILRRAWAGGVSAFIARDLVPGLEQRDRLEEGRKLQP